RVHRRHFCNPARGMAKAGGSARLPATGISMSFSSGASALHRSSPIAAAVAAPRVVVGPDGPRAETLTERLQGKLAEVRERGLRITRLEMSQAEMVPLIREAGEEAIRLDPDPAVDKA